jgi:Periplasmic protein involved in polysaccharide export
MFLVSSLTLCAANLEDEYIINVGDVLDIKVWDNDDLNCTVEVSQQGDFSFPFIEKVHASGLSIFELENIIEKKLADGYLIAPQVKVSLKEYKKQRIFVTGEVINPGEHKWERELTVRQAISMAGGQTERASPKRAIIVRKKDGVEKEFKAKMDDIVMPDDIIRVPGRYF